MYVALTDKNIAFRSMFFFFQGMRGSYFGKYYGLVKVTVIKYMHYSAFTLVLQERDVYGYNY